jgi:hypothetical protein
MQEIIWVNSFKITQNCLFFTKKALSIAFILRGPLSRYFLLKDLTAFEKLSNPSDKKGQLRLFQQ